MATSRRLKGEARFQADEHSTGIPIYYPAIAELEDEFAPWFQRIHVEALGLFLPSSDIYGVLDKRPGLRKMLMALEERCTTLPFTARFADHYWIEFRRHSGPDDRSTLA
jgi:hypothetical protein